MDFIVTLFLYGIFNLFFPKKEEPSNIDDVEHGAAYFFGTGDLRKNDPDMNESDNSSLQDTDSPDW